jgi:hypothetical protein
MNTTDNPSEQDRPLHEQFVQRVESYTKEEPVKAASAAFGAGILLAMLPIGGIVAAVFRLVFLLARPLLMILGVVKIFEHWDRRQQSEESNESAKGDPKGGAEA